MTQDIDAEIDKMNEQEDKVMEALINLDDHFEALNHNLARIAESMSQLVEYERDRQMRG